MNKYEELKENHSKRINEFPIAFAFSDKQLTEAMKKLNVKSHKELLSIQGGGLIRKTDRTAYDQLFEDMNKEAEEAQADDEYLYQGFIYELGNHEYCITGDRYETLGVLGISPERYHKDTRIFEIFNKAECMYMGSVVSW